MGTDGKRVPPEQLRSTKSRRQFNELGYAIESEIIPTLLKQLARDAASHKPKASETAPGSEGAPITWIESQARQREHSSVSRTSIEPDAQTPPPSPHWLEPAAFATLILDESEAPSKQQFERLRADGVDDKTLLLELLAPTSIELGRRWEQDISDFADVTIGVCRLHRLLRTLHPQHVRELENNAHGGRVLLMTAPGEQHSFGLLLVGELLFRAGWYTEIDIDAQPRQLVQQVSQNWYEMAGISIGGETHIAATVELIRELRTRSCNSDIAIVVGGSLINAQPEIGMQLGADQVISETDDLAEATARFVPNAHRI